MSQSANSGSRAAPRRSSPKEATEREGKGRRRSRRVEMEKKEKKSWATEEEEEEAMEVGEREMAEGSGQSG